MFNTKCHKRTSSRVVVKAIYKPVFRALTCCTSWMKPISWKTKPFHKKQDLWIRSCGTFSPKCVPIRQWKQIIHAQYSKVFLIRVSIRARVPPCPLVWGLQTGLPQAAQCISARWAVREDYCSHASQQRGWVPLCCTKQGRKSGWETEKGRETQGAKRQKCPFHRVDFSRAPMLERSSELALVQSLYANNMRCPPPAPGISVRSEDLPMRYVRLAPQPNLG